MRGPSLYLLLSPSAAKRATPIEGMRVLAYTEMMEPAARNEGGAVWNWLNSHGLPIMVGQEDPGPAYGVIPTSDGASRVDIGDWILRGADGVLIVVAKDDFYSAYAAVEETT